MIETQELTKIFDSRGIAGIHQLNLQLKEGEVAALMGPNGSGKSTLLNLLRGTLKPDRGSITIKGDITLFQPDQCPQSGNVQKFLVDSVTITDDAEKRIQLTRNLADMMEFTFQLKQDLSSLSAGQKQKILLSSMLINNPRVILLDEPFTHLDPMTRKGILSALFTYIRSQTISVFWVTHDMDEALQFSDKLGILNFGKMEQWGEPQEIIFKPRNLFVAQFAGYSNIFPIRFEDGHWMTPWGKWHYPNPSGWLEALIVIPASAWEMDENKAISFHVKNFKIKQLIWEIQADALDRCFTFMWPDSLKRQIDLKPAFYARPIWAECFLLQL